MYPSRSSLGYATGGCYMCSKVFNEREPTCSDMHYNVGPVDKLKHLELNLSRGMAVLDI